MTDRRAAAAAFDCNARQANPFDREDPFNPGTQVRGFMCRRDGPTGGSLFITHVNGEAVEPPTMVWGTPKLRYPYAGYDDRRFKRFDTESPVPAQYFVSDKWNGMNVCLFKYRDGAGRWLLSAKSKGNTFLADGDYGDFCTWVRGALGLREGKGVDLAFLSAAGKGDGGGVVEAVTRDDAIDRFLADRAVQSMGLELCGTRHPHLVAYDFEFRMVPLFETMFDGRIRPVRGVTPEREYGPSKFNQTEMQELCQRLQKEDRAANEAFRREHNLKHRYEHAHFRFEGHVLYLLDDEGFLMGRTMFKVKPQDIEEVHWANFDALMEGRVKEAVQKIAQRGKQLTEETLRDELDMGPKEWGRFGRDSSRFAVTLVDKFPELRKLKADMTLNKG